MNSRRKTVYTIAALTVLHDTLCSIKTSQPGTSHITLQHQMDSAIVTLPVDAKLSPHLFKDVSLNCNNPLSNLPETSHATPNYTAGSNLV